MRKLKPLKSTIIGCLNCGHTPAVQSLKFVLERNFGEDTILCDGKEMFWSSGLNEGDKVLLQKFEDMARKYPKKDWRLKIDRPLREAEYQRQGKNKWLLVRTGRGFA